MEIFILTLIIIAIIVVNKRKKRKQNLHNDNNTTERTSTKITTKLSDIDKKLSNIDTSFVSMKKKIKPEIEIKYRKAPNFPDNYVVIDFETTGLDPYNDSIIQLGGIRYKNDIEIERFESLVNPKTVIPNNIVNITGITNSDLKSAPVIQEILPKFVEFIGNDVIMAHNAPFDMKFLLVNIHNQNLTFNNNFVLDTLPLSRRSIEDIENHKLETIKRYLNIDIKSHDALSDCYVCAELYKYCKRKQLNNTPEMNELENQCYEIIKKMLHKNNKDLNYLSYSHLSGGYFDINAPFTIARLKTRGRSNYLLTDKDQSYILKIYPSANIVPATKSEKGINRILIQNPNDLLNLEQLFIEAFDKAVELYEYTS